MKDSLIASNNELREALLVLLWKQWSALGVAGQVANGGSAIIDPEALLLVSTLFARYDARLFDEIADWLSTNGSWINVSRIISLYEHYNLGDLSVLGALSEHLVKAAEHSKWKVLTKNSDDLRKPQVLFTHLGTPNRLDPIFARWGWLRSPLENRGLSRPPKGNQPATFLIKLRALFGRQSRAEVIAWLLTHPSGHPAQIARETGYFRGSIQNVLNDLEVSGHVFAIREGREKIFTTSKKQWQFLITWGRQDDVEFPSWVPWPVLFGLIQQVHSLIEAPGFLGHSDDLQAIELNRLITPLTSRLTAEGYITPTLSDMSVATGTAHVLDRIRQLVADLDQE